MSGKGLPEGITFRDCCPACGDEYDKWQADLARLREENATLKEALDKSEESRIGWMEGWHKKARESEAENARLTALVEEAAGIIEHYYHPAMQKSDISIAMQDWLRMAGEGKGTPAPTIINQSGLKPLGTTGKYVDQMGDVYSREGER